MADKMSKVVLPVKTGETITNKEFDLADRYIEEVSEPYVSRQGKDGLAKMELVGGTIPWNQLVQNGNFVDGSGWNTNGGTMSVANNVLTLTANAENNVGIYRSLSVVSGHKYLLTGDIKITTSASAVNMRWALSDGGAGTEKNTGLIPSGVKTTSSVIVIPTSNWSRLYILSPYTGSVLSVGDTIEYSNFMVFDLTLMFGTTIADYVYSLERSEAGSGLAWLQSYGFFTKDYYEYDTGSLQSVCTSGRKITDLDGNERTYPIDDVQLRGLFKLDTNNKLYCDGDIYKSNGAVTRKYGIVDLGTLNWTLEKTNVFLALNSNLLPIKIPASNNVSFIGLCANYINDSSNNVAGSSTDKTIGVSIGRYIRIFDTAYTNTATFKTAMSGVYLVYELATETTETADPYINPQRSLENGTEEFVDGLTRDVMIPVGNNSSYIISETLSTSAEYTDVQTDKIQQTIAPIQTTLVALKDYAVGEQFVYNGLLYEVTAAIASGGTITIDANCKLADNVTNQLLLLTSELNKLKNATRRTRRNITTDLVNLPTAVAEQDLEKYGYTIGDYFIGNSGYTYILADMNTFRGAQNNYAVINQNHISIVVKTGANSKWNEADDTSTGYSGSVLHSYLSGTVLDNIKSDMIALFGGSTGLEHLLPHKLLWTTAVSSWSWSVAAQYISALTEPQVYGINVWAIDGYQTGEAWKHLELFKKFSYMEILGWIWFWLRSIRSASFACDATNDGYASGYSASNSGGAVGLIQFK